MRKSIPFYIQTNCIFFFFCNEWKKFCIMKQIALCSNERVINILTFINKTGWLINSWGWKTQILRPGIARWTLFVSRIIQLDVISTSNSNRYCGIKLWCRNTLISRLQIWIYTECIFGYVANNAFYTRWQYLATLCTWHHHRVAATGR